MNPTHPWNEHPPSLHSHQNEHHPFFFFGDLETNHHQTKNNPPTFFCEKLPFLQKINPLSGGKTCHIVSLPSGGWGDIETSLFYVKKKMGEKKQKPERPEKKRTTKDTHTEKKRNGDGRLRVMGTGVIGKRSRAEGRFCGLRGKKHGMGFLGLRGLEIWGWEKL